MGSPSSSSPAHPAANLDPYDVVLVAAARFIFRPEILPEGVRPRDVEPLLEGLVEERAPLPLDQLSWGFLSSKLSAKKRNVLTYAAAREQVFGSSRKAAQPCVTLPSVAALYGLRVKTPTWIFLAEQTCLSAVLIKPGQDVPERILSRYLESNDDSGLWTARTRLLAEAKPAKDEVLLSGLVRVETGTLSRQKNRIDFILKRQHSLGSTWDNWQHTRLQPESSITSADLRERAILQEQKQKEQAGKSLRLALLAVFLAVATIALLEAILYSRRSVAEELAAQVARQEESVKQLKQMEAMTKSLESTLSRQIKPLGSLLALDQKRPESVYFKSVIFAEDGTIRINGSAEDIQGVNTYVDEQRTNPYWQEVKLSEVKTEAAGLAAFQLQVTPSKKSASSAPANGASANAQQSASSADTSATNNAAANITPAETTADATAPNKPPPAEPATQTAQNGEPATPSQQ